VLDEVQVGVFRDAALAGKVRPRLTWLKMQRYVRRLAGRFWALTTASRVELAHLKHIAPRAKNIHLIPNGVDTSALRPAQYPSAGKTIIYNGALTFGANLDAMQFFISQVWPLVKARAPDAKLKITGSHAGVDVAFCRMPDVELTGYVDDIAAHVRSARVCVVPLRVGGGTRLKILEAMALGVPVVATPKGAEGLNARHDEHILLAGDPADFARKVLDILNDDELCRRITSQARRLVEQTYDWASIGADFARLVESAKVSV
jgi:glycosyltransferase involved in cell wall biosynthesis